MTEDRTEAQNEFKELLETHLAKRRSSGSSRSKWPDAVVAKFGELVELGHDAKVFESMFGLMSHQYYSLNLRLRPKPKKSVFKKLKLENSSPKLLGTELYLRSASSGVELRGIQSFDEALALFVKLSR